MFKQKILVLVGIALLLLAGVVVSNKLTTPEPVKKTYSKAPLTVVLDWELTAPFELQIYYTVDKDERFSYIHSIKKSVTPEDKHLEIVIPEEKIYKFRLDFGSNPGQLELKNVEIIADQYINFNDWESYVYMYMDKIKIHRKEQSVTLISTQDDPHMSWIHPFVLYKNE
jgi:hypothetical protein